MENMEKEKKENVILLFIFSFLFMIILVLGFLILRKNNDINIIKKKYDYINELQNNNKYLSEEYDKLLVIYNSNLGLLENNKTLENDCKKMESSILSLQEKNSKLGDIK